MPPWKHVVGGVVLTGAGAATRHLGNVIVAATGAEKGPFVNYSTLMDVAGILLTGAGIVLIVYGVLRGIYGAVTGREDQEDATNPRSRTS